jgi:hypothetical protein
MNYNNEWINTDLSPQRVMCNENITYMINKPITLHRKLSRYSDMIRDWETGIWFLEGTGIKIPFPLRNPQTLSQCSQSPSMDTVPNPDKFSPNLYTIFRFQYIILLSTPLYPPIFLDSGFVYIISFRQYVQTVSGAHKVSHPAHSETDHSTTRTVLRNARNYTFTLPYAYTTRFLTFPMLHKRYLVYKHWRFWFWFILYRRGTRWRSWLQHYAISRKVAVSSPDEVIGFFFFFFNLPNPSIRTMSLGSTQPLTEMST